MARIRVGSVEILPLLDTPMLMNPHTFIPDHADQFLAEYPDQAVDPRGLFPISITCFLLRSGGKNILVDSGIGQRRRPGFPPGKLDDALRQNDLTPADIDLVVNTHLHLDHTGWNTVEGPTGKPEIYFPNARWLIQRVEWDYWMQPRFLEDPAHQHLSQCVAPLATEGRVDFAYSEQAIDENLVFVGSPGHTPGHVCIGIQSSGEKAVIVGDASHHPAQLDHPDWSPSADADPMLAARTRRLLFDESAADGRTWIAGHWPFPGAGQILLVDGRRVFRAL
ncbi:MAG: MBL fold metallo-hydrolase [Dehalococcoidia bacterium]